jgi:GntR family transcriptional regulator / MocR family aminotransferase
MAAIANCYLVDMTTLHVPLERMSGVPIHRQIYAGIRRAILDGLLRPGQQVPSTRALAVELGVSRLPVLTAYDQLLHEGYLEARTGSGTYVSRELPGDLRATRRVARSPRPRDYGGLGPFRMSLPALDQYPHALWARLVARHAHALTHAQMAYSDPAGLVPLREAIAEHVRTVRAVRCEAEHVLIVSGSQAALRLVAAVLLPAGSRVALEEPCYPGARSALGSTGAERLPVPVDSEGLSVAALRRRSTAVRAVYVTPAHQYPLGVSMTAPRRFALLEWAARNDSWVIEDDYDSEYRYVSRPLGSLQGMDAQQRVIYIGTFSKVLFPALRIGYLVLPPSLWDRFVDARTSFDLFSSTLYQLVLAEFLRDGHFTRHLRRMSAVYRERRDALLSGLERHCGGRLMVYNADAGLHLAALLPDGTDDRETIRRMEERGLTATPLSSCYASDSRPSGLLLGFGGSTARRLQDASRILGEILRAVR